MMPETSLQNRGKRKSTLRYGPRPSCKGGGQRPGNTFLPVPGPLLGPGGPNGPRAHRGPAARAWHLRKKAARAPNPQQRMRPVSHPTFALSRFKVTTSPGSLSPARSRATHPAASGQKQKGRFHGPLPASWTNQSLRHSGGPPPSHFHLLKRQKCGFQRMIQGDVILGGLEWGHILE